MYISYLAPSLQLCVILLHHSGEYFFRSERKSCARETPHYARQHVDALMGHWKPIRKSIKFDFKETSLFDFTLNARYFQSCLLVVVAIAKLCVWWNIFRIIGLYKH